MITIQKRLNPGEFLLDMVQERCNLRNDRDVADALGVSASLLSQIRNGRRVATANILLRMHERLKLDVALLRRWAGQVTESTTEAA